MNIKVGDTVTRLLAGTIPMELKVTEVTDDRIVCGGWEFDKATGVEIDEELGWGPPPKMTGSFIKSGVMTPAEKLLYQTCATCSALRLYYEETRRCTCAEGLNPNCPAHGDTRKNNLP